MNPAFFKRFRVIFFNAAARILTAQGTSIISLVIVRIHSPEVWGAAVESVLVLDFAFSIIGWGSSHYLIREFSLEPKNISPQWFWSAAARIPLLLAFLIILFVLPFSATLTGYMLIWALSRYLYQAYEPLLLYHKNFSFSLVLETTALLTVLLPLFLTVRPVSAEFIVGLMAGAMVSKAVLSTTFVFARKLVKPSPVFMKGLMGYFVAAFPFLLLTFSGMLQQRTDLYLVALYLDEKQTAVYQVFINWLIFCQFLASLLLSPFAKNIFRLPPATLRKLERNFMVSGVLLAAVSIVGMFVVMEVLYRFELTPLQYGLGYFYILMIYLYQIRNYELGRERKQALAAVFSFAASGVNLALSLYFTPQLGITGALMSATIAQVFLVILYRSKKSAYAVR